MRTADDEEGREGTDSPGHFGEGGWLLPEWPGRCDVLVEIAVRARRRDEM
jgi:hypothetical protein